MEDPRDAERWDAVEAATELMVAGEHDLALTTLRAVIEADPGNAYAYHFSGALLFELDKLEPARVAYRAAIQAAPRYLGARTGLSHCLRLLGDAAGAISEAEAALELFPDDGEALHALGLGQAAAGHHRAAMTTLHRFLGSSPELEVQLEVQGVLDVLGSLPEGEPFVWRRQ